MSENAHVGLRVLPSWAYQVLEFFYYGMFAQVGAGLPISALCFGRKTALRFAGTILNGVLLRAGLVLPMAQSGTVLSLRDALFGIPSMITSKAVLPHSW